MCPYQLIKKKAFDVIWHPLRIKSLSTLGAEWQLPQPNKEQLQNNIQLTACLGFPGGSVVKKPPANAGDVSSITG